MSLWIAAQDKDVSHNLLFSLFFSELEAAKI